MIPHLDVHPRPDLGSAGEGERVRVVHRLRLSETAKQSIVEYGELVNIKDTRHMLLCRAQSRPTLIDKDRQPPPSHF